MVARLLALIDRDSQGDLLAEQQRTTLVEISLTEAQCNIQKPAGDFILGEVIQLFQLNCSDVVSPAAPKAYMWKIEDVCKIRFSKDQSW